MTELQKTILKALFNGGNIASNPSGVFRLRDQTHNPIKKIYPASFEAVKPYLRKLNNLFVIDKKKVRKAHGKSWIKQYYKSLNIKIK